MVGREIRLVSSETGAINSSASVPTSESLCRSPNDGIRPQQRPVRSESLLGSSLSNEGRHASEGQISNALDTVILPGQQ